MTVKILVVDDEPDLELLILQKFRKQIAAKEYDFVFARNGKQALEKLEAHKDLHIIMTDINMPEMDGLTFLSALSSLNRLYKAIIISAYGDMSNIRQAMNRGASDFITKPIDFQDLEVTLKKIVNQYIALEEGARASQRLAVINEELEIARRIQQSMLPSDFSPIPNTEHYELLGKMVAAKEVGGDFFDFFPISNDQLGMIIADVSGKSISASLFMATSKTLFRTVANTVESPKITLEKVNEMICIDNLSDMFVTAFYGILNFKTGELIYASAGHNPPCVISKSGEIEFLSLSKSIPLGIDPELVREKSPLFEDRKIILKDEDSLFLYTDGVTEAINEKSELFGEENLKRVLEKCANKDIPVILDTVSQEVKDYSGMNEQSDDITMLCLRYYQTPKKTVLQPSGHKLEYPQTTSIS